MSVSTPRPGNSATRPPASRTACSEPSAWRAKWAALRRFAAPAAGDRCGHSASMTWSRTSRCPSASASRATSSAARRVGHASSATASGPTVTVSPPRSAMRTRSSATSNNAIGGRRGKASTSPRRVGLRPARRRGRPARAGTSSAMHASASDGETRSRWRRRCHTSQIAVRDQRQRRPRRGPPAGASSSAPTANAP